jgi:TolA-binding protein
MRVRLAACLTAACVIAAPFAARAQIESREGIALQNQILELRQQLESLRAQVPRGGTGGSVLGGYQPTPLAPAPAAGALSAQLLDRVQRLEDAVRDLRGQVDEAANTREREYQELNKKIDDLAFKLGAAPPAAATAADTQAPGEATTPPPATPGGGLPTPPPPPPPPAAKRTPELILQEGRAALARRDYATAEADAKEVLANGKGPRATDAQFLLAQVLAARKDYSAAAVAYDDAYNRSRTGPHAQDSLLGLANALTAINEKRAACETLDKLRAEFPTPRADLREPIAQARKSAGCH